MGLIGLKSNIFFKAKFEALPHIPNNMDLLIKFLEKSYLTNSFQTLENFLGLLFRSTSCEQAFSFKNLIKNKHQLRISDKN